MPTVDGSDPLTFLGALALLIGLGFVGNLIFSKLRVNDTLLLILVGVFVGPILGYIDAESLAGVSSIVGPLALILILFDGGLALKFHDLMHGLGSAAVLGVVGFFLTMAVLGAITAQALGLPMLTGMILGAILAGTSALVVLPSLEHMNVKKKTGTTLGLESALTDVLVVVVSFTVMSLVAAATAATVGANETAPAIGDYAQSITARLLAAFVLGAGFGGVGGLIWLFMYPKIRDKAFGYMLTLGFMFFLYVATEWILAGLQVSGGGPLAVLAFGITLGNYESMGQGMISKVGESFGAGMKRFQGEISFLVRTFFFIYLGVLVDLEVLKDVGTWALGMVLLAGLYGARYLAVALTARKWKLQDDNFVMFLMGPRGLAAAVLAAEPAAMGIAGTEKFVPLAFIILVMTNLIPTVGTIALERAAKRPKKPAKPKKEKPAKQAKPAKDEPAKRTAKESTKAMRQKKIDEPASFKLTGATEEGLEDFGKKGKK